MFGSRTFQIVGGLLAAAALTFAACSDSDADADEATPDSTPAVTSTASPDTIASPTATATPGDPATSSATPDPEVDVVEEAAPVVSAEVVSLDSAPPQYVARVVSAQPDGCYKFARFEVDQDGATINVTVLNTRPADMTVVLCLAQYSETSSDIPLGQLEAGTEYTLSVNGEKQTFVAE